MGYSVGMSLYLCHRSSLDYWRSFPSDAKRPPCARTRVLAHGFPEGITPLVAVERIEGAVSGNLRRPVHILVPDKGSRCQSPYFVSHVWQHAMPPRTLVAVSDGLYVAAPELCFVHMATTLDIPRLACLGFELCGGYSVSTGDQRGFIDRTPLTSVARIESLLDEIKGMRGCVQARRALRFVLAGSASPMETILVILLHVPRSLGGYGIPAPVLNYRVEVGRSVASMVEKSHYACDACWPQSKIAVEYESDSYHTGSSRIARDSKRRNELIAMGFEILTVTRKQLFEYYTFDRFAHQLAKRLEYRMREHVGTYDPRRMELRKLLFDTIANPL